MLSSKRNVSLLLIAITILIAIPNMLHGATLVFEARIEEYWTGHLKIGSAYEKVDDTIRVGYENNSFPAPNYRYRGWATFYIDELPADACVSQVRLFGNCNSKGAGNHQLAVVSLLTYPPGTTPSALANAIGTSREYQTCDDCMRTLGTKSIELLGGAASDLEKAAQGADLHWFAVGFRESGENSASGSWSGVYALEYPTLRVYYSTPVRSAPTVVSSDYLPCVGESYTISWDSIPGAESYFVRIGSGAWTSNLGQTSKTIVNTSAYTAEIRVRGQSGCGPGPESDVITVESFDPPSRPSKPTASDVSPCRGDTVTISWLAVSGAIHYRLSEKNTAKFVYSGPGTSVKTVAIDGTYEYKLSVDNGCQWSDLSPRLGVFTRQELVIQGPPVSDRNPAKADEEFTVSWAPVPGADLYELWDSGVQGGLLYIGIFPQVSMTLSTPGEYRLSVLATNDCRDRATGPELVLIVDASSAIEDDTGLELPVSYSLSQNYPNPFNPATRIEFSLKRPGRVELKVYNMLGELVRTLVNERLSAGNIVVDWNGRDDFGRTVTSGVYFYKLTTGDFVKSRKMILLK